MIIDTILKIDTASFATGMGKSVQMVQSFIQIGQGLADKFKSVGENTIKAFDLGGHLSDVSAQIGETAGEVMVLERAFKNAGLAPESMAQSVAIMGKAIAGADEQGKGTAETFKKLGLDADKLSKLSVADRMETIGGALMGVANTSDRAQLAMSIFGKSGAKMLTLFSDAGAFASARSSLGGIVSVMDRAAPAFDAISDRIGNIKEKSMGFWAGFAEGVLPAAEAITQTLEAVDLSSLGQKFGNVVSAWIEMIRTNDLGEIMRLQFVVGWQKSVDMIASGVEALSIKMVDWFGAPLIYFRSSFQKIIEEIMGLVAKIPKLNSMLGLEGFKANAFKDILKDQTDLALASAKDGPSFKVYGNTDEQKQLAAAWERASVSVAAQQKKIEAAAAAVKPMGTGVPVEPSSSGKSTKAGVDIRYDALTRIGGFFGASAASMSMIRIASDQRTLLQKIAANTSRTTAGNRRSVYA